MRDEYDLSKIESRPNPYAKILNAQFPPILQKAVRKFAPGYFDLDSAGQEEFRASISGDVQFKIRQFLMAELLNITVADKEELDDIRHDLTNAQHSTINSVMCLLCGIGEDFFFLNEFFQEGKTLLDYETLYDHDFEDFTFQEKCRKEEFKNHKPGTYNGSLYFDWARLFVDGHFTYASLCMTAGHIMSELDNYGDEIIEKLIPYEWEEGPEHGKPCGDEMTHWDMRKNANGFEKELKELNKVFWDYLRDRREAMEVEFGKLAASQIFILERNEKDEKNLEFVFTDKDVLSKIRFKTFMRDCRNFEQADHSILLNRIKEEKVLLKKYLKDQHNKIEIL